MHSRETRLKRLADTIDGLIEKDQQRLNYAREIAAVRRKAAVELYTTCANFVVSVNQLLSRGGVQLDPPDFSEDSFQEEGIHLFQINARGRILQIEFGATTELVSSEDFRVPYTMDGSIHAFNQELLENHVVVEQLLYYTLEKSRKWWRFFDARTYRSGPVDEDYLVALMEHLV
jgi:hypothetical protein